MKGNGWGGARNRKDRFSDALTRAQCEALTDTLKASISLNMPFNRMLTIHWENLGVAPADSLAVLTAFNSLARNWAHKRGYSIAFVWIRENDFGDGSKGEHVHILLHIPEPILREFIETMTQRWLLRVTGCKYVKGTARFDTIGQRASDYRNAPDIYRENLGKLVFGYLFKGASKEAARELSLSRWDDGGRIVGKRWGRSQNLNTTNFENSISKR
jgi:hypothetical protein